MKKKNYRSIPVLIDTSRPINQKKLDYLRSPSNIDSEEEEEYAKVRGEARDFQDFSSEPAYRGHYSGEECLRRGFMIAPRERPSPRRHIRALSCTSRRQKLVTRIYIYIHLQSRCTGTALIFSARSLRGYRSWIRFECIRERVQSGWEYVGEKRMDARAWRVERISFLSLGRVRAKSGETRLVMEGWRKKPMREGFVRSSPRITAPDSTRRLSFPWVMSGESWSEEKNSRGGREVV